MKKILMMILASAFGLGAWGVTVTTEADLRTAIANGGTVTLGGNIALTEEIPVGTTVTLDLGTYTISSPTNVFRVAANGNFTVNADASNPGGISVPTNRCCVYTSYGWDPGAKTVVLNGGVFTGNCVFNWSETASENIEELYDFMPDGYGSGEKAVPTSVTINGGTFTGGYEDGNVGEYRCYYFTVNGGTFEKGLDCADTRYGSFGVTSTCKAFFKGGKYRNRYPAARTQDPGKVFIGTETANYVYYIDGDYYVIAPDYSACEATACYDGACVEETSWFYWLVSHCHQRWTTTGASYRWYFLTYAQAASWGTDPQYVNAASGGDGAASAPALRSPARLLSAAPRARLLSSGAGYAADNALPTATKDNFAGQDGYATVTFGGIEGTDLADYLRNPDYNGTSDKIYLIQDRTDLDACRVLTITQPASGGSVSLNSIYTYYSELSNTTPLSSDEMDCLIEAAKKAVEDGGYEAELHNNSKQNALKGLAELKKTDAYYSSASPSYDTKPFKYTHVSAAIKYLADHYDNSVGASDDGDTYATWTTDIIVSFDKDVEADTVNLFVGGTRFGDSMDYKKALKATISGENGTVLSARNAYVFTASLDTGYESKAWGSFYSPLLIAIKNTSPANAGTTATVALRHSKAGEADVIRAYFTCTFTKEAAVAQLPNGINLEGLVFEEKGTHDIDFSSLTYLGENGENLASEYARLIEYANGLSVKAVFALLRSNGVNETLGSAVTGLDGVSTEEAGDDMIVSKYLSVSVSGLQIKGLASGNKSLGAIIYNVVPRARIIDDSSDTTRTITNAEIGGKTITFRLPLTDDFTAKARVVHTSEGYPTERWIADVGGEAGARYVEISTTHFSTFTVSPVSANVATTSVQASNLFGAIEVTGGAANMYVAVPFEGFGSAGAARTAQDVVHAANLAADTKMYVYDGEKESHDVYKVASGAWTPAPKVTINSGNEATQESADLSREVPAGTGVLVQRKDTAQSVYVYGQVPGTAVNPEPFAKGRTFVSPPFEVATVEVGGVKYVNLNAFTWTGVKATTSNRVLQNGADYIQFRDKDNNLRQYFFEKGSWGVPPRQTASYGALVTDGRALIPQGTAFWYSTAVGGAKVEWK